MSNKILWYNIITDTESQTAASFVAKYPTRFASESDVPEHLYKPVSELWTGSVMSSGDFAKFVSYSSSKTQRADGSIVVLNEKTFPDHKIDGLQSDQNGAETTFCRVVLYKPKVTNDLEQANRITNTSLRIVHILDQYIRNERRVRPNQLTINWDKTIGNTEETDYFHCYWEMTEGPETTQEDSVLEMLFKTEYVRLFLA